MPAVMEDRHDVHVVLGKVCMCETRNATSKGIQILALGALTVRVLVHQNEYEKRVTRPPSVPVDQFDSPALKDARPRATTT